MIETDYVSRRPPQPPRAEDESQASWGFPFGYITPQEAHLQAVMRRMYPTSAGPLTDIPGSGPAPVMMRAHEWATVGSRGRPLSSGCGSCKRSLYQSKLHGF